MARTLLVLAAALACAACGAPDPLAHKARNADGSPYLAPVCLAHLDELRALPIAVDRVPRGHPALLGQGGYYYGADHPLIVIPVDATRAELDHEFCHAWLDRTTGNPNFHR